MKGKHKCYNCQETFNWQFEVAQGYGVGRFHTITGTVPKFAFTSADEVEVTASCSRCLNDNKFTVTV